MAGKHKSCDELSNAGTRLYIRIIIYAVDRWLPLSFEAGESFAFGDPGPVVSLVERRCPGLTNFSPSGYVYAIFLFLFSFSPIR